MVSIIILTHNAPEYVKLTLESLSITKDVEYEVIVLDNASEDETKDLLWFLKKRGLIKKLIYESENTFFSRGNNLAFKFCDKNSKFVLFLNSDIEIKDPFWLKKMLSIHKNGATSLGLCMTQEGRFIADGYCLLIDKDLYERFPMREDYEWWYSLTYTESQLLKNEYSILAVKNHEELIHHFGGKSGDAWKSAKGMNTTENLSDRWLEKCKKQVNPIFSLSKGIGNDKEKFNMIRGVSSDDWCAPIVDFEIKTLDKGKIKLDGYYPNLLTGDETGAILVDGKMVSEFTINQQSFSFDFSAPQNSIVHVTIKSDFSFQATPPDVRELSFILSNVVAY